MCLPLFISFITTLFYNMWVDSVRRAAEKGGDWQAGAQPSLLTGFYFVIMCMVCLSMALVLYHAFVMGADERMHQLGILQTVGATPGQIRACLLQEAPCFKPAACAGGNRCRRGGCGPVSAYG